MTEIHTEELLDRLAAEALPDEPAPLGALVAAAEAGRRRHIRRRRLATAAVTVIIVGGAGAASVSSLWHGTDRADVDQQVATDGAPVNDSNGRVNDGPTGSVLERSEFGGMSVDDVPYTPGEIIRITWPPERRRGIGYTLDVWSDGNWQPAYGLRATTVDGQSTIPSEWWPVSSSGAVFDIGLRGPGPDLATLPDTAIPGTYRLCTSNSRRPACTTLEIG